MVKRTEAELEALKSRNGGYNRATLKMLGVPWPPPKGWRKALLNGDELPAPTDKVKKLVPMAEFVAKYGTGNGSGTHVTTCTATACSYPDCGCLT